MKIFYFTGTGNSHWTAKRIGKYFSAEVCSIMNYKNEKLVIVDDTDIGIVCPIYMSDIPWIVKEFLLKLSVSRKAYVFTILTSNVGKNGKGIANIDHALLSNEQTLSLAFDLQMPGNCIESSAEQDKDRLRSAPEKTAGFCKAIEKRERNVVSDNQKAGNKFVQKSWLYSPCNILKWFKIKNNCTSCGICVKICPMKNITISEGKTIHGKSCAACYACIHWCPTHSRIVNIPMLRKLRQYHHPEVTIGDIVISNQEDKEWQRH